MAHHSVLVVEPSRSVLASLLVRLQVRGLRPVGARTPAEAAARTRESAPSAAVLALGLPGDGAVEVLRRFRAEFATSRIPVLLRAERGQERLVAEGLEAGAVDYTTPSDPESALKERVLRMVRWGATPGRERILRAGGLVLDVDAGALRAPRTPGVPTPTELGLLRRLMTAPGRAFTRRMLREGGSGTERAVDAHVATLRRKLGAAGRCIETLRGVGYRLDVKAAEALPAPGTISA